MSTTAATYQLSVDRREPEITPAEQGRVVHSYGETFARPEAVRFHPARKSFETSSTTRKQVVRTKRRLKGFLVELQGDGARVAFVENGKTVLYDLPAQQLRRAGINVRNQPFQMDEIEAEIEGGGFIVGYRFLPLAKPSDAYIETLSFDAERRRKRDFILKEFGKA